MISRLPRLAVLLLTSAVSLSAASLFDGKTLHGWEGDAHWWRVQDGVITGGSSTEKIPRNFFLATTRSFQNFDLRLKIKLTGDPKTGMINSGVQLRSLRVPENTEMSGYQVDAGAGYWGTLYDESRRKKTSPCSANSSAFARLAPTKLIKRVILLFCPMPPVFTATCKNTRRF